MFQRQSAYRRLIGGSLTIWMLFLLPIIIGLFAFSLDLGMVYYAKSQAQTAADTAALAGADVLKRVFKERTTDMSALCKAGHVGEAVMEAAEGAGIAAEDVEMVYCPRSSEVTSLGGNPCVDLPTDAECDAACYCGGLSDSIIPASKPGDGLYPLNVELAGSEEDTAAYVYVTLTRRAERFFFNILSAWSSPEVPARAIAVAKEVPLDFNGAGYFQPYNQISNDPQSINLRSGSTLSITNGGMFIQDDPNNTFTATAPKNTLEADWIAVAGDYNPSPQIAFDCNDLGYFTQCPEEIALEDYPEELQEYLDSFEPPVFPSRNCNDVADTSVPCDYDSTRRIYRNCVITPANSTVPLLPGTYCGGLTIDDVNVQFTPLVSSGVVVDDVYYFVSGPDNHPGQLVIMNSANVVAGNGGVADAGVFLYAPEAPTPSSYALEISDNSHLTGEMLLWIDHLRLTRSTLSYRPYAGGLNHFPRLTRVLFNLVQ